MPGQSIRGPEVKLPVNDDSYADWMLDVMDGLGLPSTNLFGVSWGGFVARLPMPTHVIAGTDDISFSGSAELDRVRRLVPNVETELINDCKHCPPTTDIFRVWLGDRLSRFIHDEPEPVG